MLVSMYIMCMFSWYELMADWGMLLARSAEQYIRVLSLQGSGLEHNTFYTEIVRAKNLSYP